MLSHAKVKRAVGLTLREAAVRAGRQDLPVNFAPRQYLPGFLGAGLPHRGDAGQGRARVNTGYARRAR